MKTKKTVLGAIILSILIMFTAADRNSMSAIDKQKIDLKKFQKVPKSESTKAHTLHFCKVKMVGPGWGNIYLNLTDLGGDFSNRWFIARADQKKEMLSVGLTAISNNIEVSVILSSKAPYGKILGLYLGTLIK